MKKELLATDFLDRATDLYGDSTGVITNDGTTYTYAEFGDRVNQLSHALTELGIEQGDRVAVLSPNTHWFLETLYAVTQLGAIHVALNYRLTPEDYRYILDDCGADVVVADYEYAGKVQAVRDDVDVDQFVGYEADRIEGAWRSYEELLAGRPTARPDRPAIEEADPAVINYTSGTTGDPKGVVRTHRTEHYHALCVTHHMEIEDSDTYLWTLPMFHCNGWGHEYAITGVGGTHVCQRDFSAERTFEQIREHDVSYLCGAPVVLNRLIEHAKETGCETTGDVPVRLATGANAPPESTIRNVEDEMGWTLIHLYGLTETAPVITTSNAPAKIAKNGRVYTKNRQGFAVLGAELRVVDEDGEDVPRDDETMGEIVVRGNQVMDRYWNKPEQTERAFNDRVEGWFHTGDIATIDADGMVSICDRKKDIIVSGGENISSLEVENAIYDHPAVTKTAVVGIPHEEWQETPLALVVTRADSTLTTADLESFLREKLAGYKVPTRIELVDDEDLPETATGKIQKTELRDRYAAE
ncbi:long-chain-fatty-acid--CoA ligase [Halorarius litoreus]|uniref:long-chain-fatty-acid--CoA ligase n=1 Tax=Halorarius litoreus TaxID=2962676 RepID=UPI0020CB6CF3|nr:long-chain-fatty-acid--CoA ligase [Halorarius litoreus]